MVRSETITQRLVLLFLPAFVISCADDEQPSTPEDTGTEDVADVGRELPIEDVTPIDAGNPDTGTIDQGAEPILCRYCRDNLECGPTGENLCLQLPSGESACGLDCSANEEICPEGFFCANVEGAAMQCVPENLYCQNQCGDPPIECETDGEVCDPLTGHCGPPLGLCEECAVDEQCGPGNICLSFPDIDNSRACGRACNGDNPCPDPYLCAAVDELGTIQQCVPPELTCVDRCSSVVCEEPGYGCNPLNGECEPPLAFCDECLASSQCGGTLDLCVALADENAYCLQDCASDANSCPEGSICIPVGLFQQCVPIEMTCVNHCLEPDVVECDEGQNCDPIEGTCHTSLVELCGRPCDNNYDCGGQNDLCLRFADDLTGGAFCARDCSDTDPCPIGYRCGTLTDNVTQQCVPGGYDDPSCALCAETVCPEGEFCRPSDGLCFPEPTPCVDHSECPPGELCNDWEYRCEPVGLPCNFGQYDCDWTMECSATSLDTTGMCLQDCSVLGGCPSTAPACERYHQVWDSCVERGLGHAERCARLMNRYEPIGRPCPTSDTETGCYSTATTCLTDMVEGVPGFCTLTCNPDNPIACTSGSICRKVTDTSGAATTETDEFYCVPPECGCLASPDLDTGEADILQDALDELDLSRCDLGFTAVERHTAGLDVANDAYRLELVGFVRNEGLYGASVVRDQNKAADADITLAEAIELAADDLGWGEGDATASLGTPTFCTAIQNLFAVSDPERPTCETLDPLGAQLPTDDLRAQVTTVIAAVGWAAQTRDGLLAGVVAEDFDTMIDTLHGLLLQNSAGAPDLAASTIDLLNFKYDTIYAVAAELAEIVESAVLDPGVEDVSAVDIQVETPYGLIVLRGSDSDTYCPAAEGCDTGTVLDSHVLLLIDFVGDDEYRGVGGATVGFDQAVSVLIDVAGDDTYTYAGAGVGDGADADGRAAEGAAVSLSNIGRQGSSRGGIGFLFDWGQGQDIYESLRMSQGFGLLGVGALVDDGCTGEVDCTDTFTVEAAGQGAGLFGIGVLLLGDGNTEQTGVNLVQGAGGPLGAGVLIDIGGDDSYVATPGATSDVLYAAPTRAATVVPEGDSNWSVAQGAAVGVASVSSLGGGHISGGIGLLVDLGGDDAYSAGILAQGAGYRHGLGMLIDAAGSDQYDCYAFSQGSGIDFGAGVLAEQDGDDTYNEIDSNDRGVLGSGDGFGMGLVIEEVGNDTYRAGPQSLGTGNFNGAGLFIDNDGNDSYDNIVSERTMGKATLPELGLSTERENARTIGLFVDANGSDQYPSGERGPGSNTSWTQVTPGEPRYEWGIGADGMGGSGVNTLLP